MKYNNIIGIIDVAGNFLIIGNINDSKTRFIFFFKEEYKSSFGIILLTIDKAKDTFCF